MRRYSRKKSGMNKFLQLFLWTCTLGFFIVLTPQLVMILALIMLWTIVALLVFTVSYTLHTVIGRWIRSRFKWTQSLLMK